MKWQNVHVVFAGFPVAVLLAGCASTPLEFTKSDPELNFQRYSTVVIREFENSVGADLPAQVPVQLRAAVETHLGKCYPTAFRIGGGGATTGPEVLIVEGKITEYREGSRFARFMLIGLGSAKFASDMIFLDGENRKELAQAKVDLLWALGGIAGAATGIEDLVKKAATQVADAIAGKKGVPKAQDC